MPSSFSTSTSTGKPWVSQPALRGTYRPAIVRYRRKTSLNTRVSTCPLCGSPLAVGGPSLKMKGGWPSRRSKLFSNMRFSSQKRLTARSEAAKSMIALACLNLGLLMAVEC